MRAILKKLQPFEIRSVRLLVVYSTGLGSLYVTPVCPASVTSFVISSQKDNIFL